MINMSILLAMLMEINVAQNYFTENHMQQLKNNSMTVPHLM